MTEKAATDRTYNVLFLCTGNSARSVMAESIINRLGAGRFRGYSGGSHPTGQINPHAKALLRHLNYPTDPLRSKDWSEFAKPDAPEMDFVITVCDNAAGEVCPIWPGQPMTAHWGFPDPAKFEGTEAEISAQFADVYRQIERRIDIFVNLPFRSLDRLALHQRLRDIGKMPLKEGAPA
jgi:arsenate reductase